MGYLDDRLGDLRAFVAEARRAPNSLPQNTLGLLAALLSRGELVETRDGWRGYQMAKGIGPWLPRAVGQSAITIGNLTFCGKPMEPGRRLYWHEFAHYEQSCREGWRWLPRYLRAMAKVRGKHDANPYEKEAELRGRELLMLYRGDGPVNV